MISELDLIKSNLQENSNINDEIRNKIIDLSKVIKNKLPEVKLDNLAEKLKTFKIGKMGKFERKGIYRYDPFKNEILFSKNFNSGYDIDNLLMKALLEMTTNNNSFTGFNSDERLSVLNTAYTEILANFLVGNDGDSELEEEMLVTNLLSHIIGKEVLFNSYFSNNGAAIIQALQDSEVGLL